MWQWNITHNPVAWAAHLNLASELMAGQRPDRIVLAFPEAREAYRLRPDVEATVAMMARMCHAQGDDAEAEGFYRLALSTPQPLARDWNQLGEMYLKGGQTQKALLALREAVRVDPGLSLYHQSLAMALSRGGQRDEAVKEYGIAIALDADNLPARYNLANLLLDLDRPAEAVPLYQAVLVHQPNHADSWYNLAFAWSKVGDLARAKDAKAHAEALEAQHRSAPLQ
jgi:tetratricopeptide (TPR) repeat protein